MMKQLSPLVLLSLILCGQVHATNYYVDAQSGSDSNSGTSTTRAWRTLGKVDSFDSSPRFQPGDTISFRRGHTFRGTITFRSSGTSGSRIVLKAYGSGSRPILDAAGDSDSVFEAVSGTQYVTLEDLRFTGSRSRGIMLISAGSNYTIRRCELDHNVRSGIRIQNRSGVQLLDNQIHHNANTNGVLAGVTIWQDSGKTATGMLIRGNEIYSNRGTANEPGNGIRLEDANDGTGRVIDLQIVGNHIHDNGDFSQTVQGRGISGDACGSVAFYENVIRDSSSSGLVLEEGSGQGNCLLNVEIVRNIFFDNPKRHILVRAQTGTTKVFHNIFISQKSGALAGPGITTASDSTGPWIIKNNIFYLNSRHSGVSWFVAPQTKGPLEADYNLYFTETPDNMAWGRLTPDFAAWQARGHDPHGIAQVNPALLDYNPNDPAFGNHDFRLRASSPAIDTGIRISGIGQIVKGGAPDIGKYEGSSGSATISCDLNSDSSTNIVDVQLALNQALGIAFCSGADLDSNGRCDIVDVQRFVNAALGADCRIGP